MTVLLRRNPASNAADVAFLRDRCSDLQRALSDNAAGRVITLEETEGEVLTRWTALLVPDEPWSPDVQSTLEDLYVLQARVLERMARGGVGDISPDALDQRSVRLIEGTHVTRTRRAERRSVRACCRARGRTPIPRA